MKVLICAAAMMLCLASETMAQVRITEWMYSGIADEFIEITNVGGAGVDLTGWSYDDDSRVAGTVDLSIFGVLAPGESALITERSAADFRASWGLAPSAKILGENATNIGRSDELNIFDSSAVLVDRLFYGDNVIVGSIRTQNFSGNPGALSDLGANNVANWVLSADGDSYGSYVSLDGDVGNPGSFNVVPEPASLALVGLCMIGLAIRRR